MITNTRCAFCGSKINDREEVLQNCATKQYAHRRCVSRRPYEKISETPMPSTQCNPEVSK